MLCAMRYKTFTWPNNPATYTLSCQRQTAVHKAPAGGFAVQDLGQTCTVMRGEGAFYGADAFEIFAKLVTVFQDDGPGILVHPVWNNDSVYFTRLQLTQEPRPDYVAYSFEFCENRRLAGFMTTVKKEQAVKQEKKYVTVQQGQTLWAICAAYKLSMVELLQMNPGISNPNGLLTGQKVRVA